MKFSIQTILTLFVILAGSFMLALAQSQSRVRIHITDSYGNVVPAERITVDSEGVTKQVRQDEVVVLRYGPHTLEASVPGFSNAMKHVVIDQPEQIIPVAMKLGAMEGPVPVCAIAGHVIPESAADRIRLVQTFGTYISPELCTKSDGLLIA
jgi:hypothetical protein